jgi:hypothetical protein
MSEKGAEAVVTPQFLERFSEGYLAAWNGHDASAMTPLVTADVVWRDPALPEPARGEAAVRAFMQDSWRAFPDLAFEETGPPTIGPDGRVVIQWRMRGTNEGPIDPPGFAATGRAGCSSARSQALNFSRLVRPSLAPT